MKRLVLTLFLLLPFVLTSCRVHFFDRQYDVPWWLIAIPEAIFIVLITYIIGRSIASEKYACPLCGKTFYPKVWAVIFSFHMGNQRALRCPHCGKKDMCSPSYDQ